MYLTYSSPSVAFDVLSFLHNESPLQMQYIVHGSLAAVQRHCAVLHGDPDEQQQ